MWGPPCDYDAQPPPATGESKPAAPDKLAGAAEGCDPNYSGACVPRYPHDVDCGDIPEKNFRDVAAVSHGKSSVMYRITCTSRAASPDLLVLVVARAG